MRTETIFYQLFQTFPTLLMELLGEDPASIASYQFTSVEVKEKAFRFDGVFLPQSEDTVFLLITGYNSNPFHRCMDNFPIPQNL